jgi:RHS repeat-associated protein
MLMPGRKFDAGSSYRYGYNGQEKSDDVTPGNYTAEYWEYDSRTGRRWNPDPVVNISESRYATFGNNPIYYSDPDGDFKTKFGAKWYKFWHGENGDIGKSETGKRAGEWYISRTGGDGKKGDGKGTLDEVIVVNPIYGKGQKLDNALYNTQNWWNSVEFTSQTNVEVNIGVQAGVNVKVNNFINLKAEGGLVVNKLLDIKADAYHMDRAKISYGFEVGEAHYYLQKNFLNIGIEAGIPKTALTGNLGYDYIQTEKYYNGYYGPRTIDTETSKGWNGNLKFSPFK